MPSPVSTPHSPAALTATGDTIHDLVSSAMASILESQLVRLSDPERLLDARGAASLMQVSERHWAKMVADGNAPQPLRLGKLLPRWSRASLIQWIRDGCPRAGQVEPASLKVV